MKTITLMLTPEVAKQVLPSLEKQYKLLFEQATAVKDQIDRILEGLASPVPADELFTPKVSKTDYGRAKKGETEKAVSEYLQAVNGQGARIGAIAKATGTTYGSVRRILHNLETQRQAFEEGGAWRWKH